MKRLTLLVSCLIVCGVLSAEADAPPIGWTVPVRVVEVYDGDRDDVSSQQVAAGHATLRKGE